MSWSALLTVSPNYRGDDGCHGQMLGVMGSTSDCQTVSPNYRGDAGCHGQHL